jgi:hypothetical protein
MGPTVKNRSNQLPALTRLFFVLVLINNGTLFNSFSQCSSGCTQSFSTCANIASISASTGTAGSNYVTCISPPAGCGTITVGAVQLGQYQRLIICTNSPTDTVKFINNFAASGGGSAASNDNTRFVDVYGNAQFTFGGTVVFNSRIVLTVASTASLNLVNSTLFTFQNTSNITNAGKIISSTDLGFGGPVANTGTITSGAALSFVSGSSLTNSSTGIIKSTTTFTISPGSGNSITNNGKIIAGCNLNITSGTFTNTNYVSAGCNTTVSTPITNSAYFKTSNKLTLNASGTFHFQNGLFDVDSLILNGGNIDAGTGCAAFQVRLYSSIQNGSAFTSTPASSVGIYDTGNPGYIDHVSVGCGGSNPDVPYHTGPYCGIIPLTGLGSSGSGCFSSLPVQWVSLKASSLNDSKVRVAWQTASEIDNDYFTVQRSPDAMYFTDIGKVKSKGYSNVGSDYYFDDVNTLDGVVFYRIKQTDHDGNSTVSDVIAVNCNHHTGFHFDVFPNPTLSEEEFNVSLEGIEDGSEVLVVLTDQLGSVLYSKVFISSENQMLIALSKEVHIPKGIYYITASSLQTLNTKKLIIE